MSKSSKIDKPIKKGKPSEEKISFHLEFFQKGGGSCPNPNFFRNFFVLFMFGHFFRKGLGVALFQTFGGTFLLEFGRFSERGGGYLIPKSLMNFSA